MTLEEKIAEVYRLMPVGNIEDRLTPEVIARLQEVVHRAAVANIDALKIANEQAALLAKSPEEAQGITAAIAVYITRESTIESLRLDTKLMMTAPDLMTAPPSGEDDSILDSDTIL